MGVRNTIFYSLGFYLAKVCWLLSGIKIGNLVFGESSGITTLTEGVAAANSSVSWALMMYASLIFIGILLYYKSKLPEVKKGIAVSQVLLFMTVVTLTICMI